MKIAANKHLINFVSEGEILTINEMLKLVEDATPEMLTQAEANRLAQENG